MSQSVPQQPSPVDAARGDVPAAPRIDPPLPEASQPSLHSPIEREIARSERASAALAATRALARAAFTDSQLAADDAAGDIDESGWIRTEYASLDPSVRAPQDSAPHVGASRTLVGGSFNPGIVAPNGRGFHAAPIGHAPIRTRTGAEARFMQESRQSPRADRLTLGSVRHDHTLTLGASAFDKPALVPGLATPAAAPLARPTVAQKRSAPVLARARTPVAPGEPFRFAIAAGLGAVIVLMAGGVSWKAGWLPHGGPANDSAALARVAAQAEAARLLSSTPAEIALAPAAGRPPPRSNAEVDAALAAAARAAAVPADSVRAAGPARLARSVAAPVAPPTTAPAAAPARHSTAPAVHGQDGVDAAIANAQARADNFLGAGHGTGAQAETPQVKPQQ